MMKRHIHRKSKLNESLVKVVILVKAGIQSFDKSRNLWVPAGAGMALDGVFSFP
jgi:hypothetical protein